MAADSELRWVSSGRQKAAVAVGSGGCAAAEYELWRLGDGEVEPRRHLLSEARLSSSPSMHPTVLATVEQHWQSLR